MTNLPVIRRNEHIALGRSDVELHRAVRSGTLIRIAPGSYIRPLEWQELEPGEQHRTRVLEFARRLHPDTVFSHFAAASLWRIRLLGTWPDEVHVTASRAAGGRSEGMVVRHCTGLNPSEVHRVDGLLVTSPARTAVDVARVLPFTDAVVAMDSALAGRFRRPLALLSEFEAIIERNRGRPGMNRARAAARFATPLSDSPEESHSRVLLRQLGFPAPELQRSFPLPDGGVAEVDFFWEQWGHVGECDGRSKYRDPGVLRGRRPEDVVIAEKNRENQLRRVVGRVSRWEPAELYRPQQFYDHLVRDGLPSSRPRPPAHSPRGASFPAR